MLITIFRRTKHWREEMQERSIHTNDHIPARRVERVPSFSRKSILSVGIMFCCIASFLFREEVHAQSASSITANSAVVSGYCGSYIIENTTEVKYSGKLWFQGDEVASVPAGGSVTVPLTGLSQGTNYAIGLVCRCDSGQPAALCTWMCMNVSWGCGWAADSSFVTKSCEGDPCCGNSCCGNPCCGGGGSGSGGGSSSGGGGGSSSGSGGGSGSGSSSGSGGDGGSGGSGDAFGGGPP